jgi:o-succinylbenzoate---CoA ligase
MGIDINHVNMTTAELLKQACRVAGDKTYMYFVPQDVGETFEEYMRQVNQISHFFERDMKIKPGAKVCIMSDNSPELLHAISAVTSIGAIWVPVNTQLVGESLRYIIDESDAQIVFTSAVYEKRVDKTKNQIKRTLEILRLEDLAEKASRSLTISV